MRKRPLPGNGKCGLFDHGLPGFHGWEAGSPTGVGPDEENRERKTIVADRILMPGRSREARSVQESDPKLMLRTDSYPDDRNVRSSSLITALRNRMIGMKDRSAAVLPPGDNSLLTSWKAKA